MSKWRKMLIEEVADFNPSENIRKGVRAKKIPMDRLGNFEKKIKGFEISVYSAGPKFRNEDTLVAKITPCLENGKTAFVDILDENEVAFGSSEFIVLRANQNSYSEFVYYLARSPLFRARAISCMEGTSGRKRVNEGALKRQEILIPGRDDQQKIASVLSALDAKIELNNRINAELEAMAKTIYDYWFVQFDFPDKNGKPYKSSGGKMVWNEELKQEVPAGWEVKKFSEWIDSDKSGDWGNDTPQGNYVKKVICIRGADINGLNGTDTLKPPVRYILEKNTHKLLSSHDLIIEISGGSPTQSTGRLALITDDTLERFEDPLICSNFCKALSLNDPKMLYNFAYYWNHIYDNGVLFGYEGKTSGIKNLLFDSFVNSYWTVMPEESVAYRFYAFMEEVQSKKQLALAESQHLAALRDWLLPMLMNGQVKVGG